MLLESQPSAAAVEDTAGRLPLHVAVDKHRPWLRLIETLIAAYPDGCKTRDGELRQINTVTSVCVLTSLRGG